MLGATRLLPRKAPRCGTARGPSAASGAPRARRTLCSSWGPSAHPGKASAPCVLRLTAVVGEVAGVSPAGPSASSRWQRSCSPHGSCQAKPGCSSQASVLLGAPCPLPGCLSLALHTGLGSLLAFLLPCSVPGVRMHRASKNKRWECCCAQSKAGGFPSCLSLAAFIWWNGYQGNVALTSFTCTLSGLI